MVHQAFLLIEPHRDRMGMISDLPCFISLDIWSQRFPNHGFPNVSDGIHSLVENDITDIRVK